MIPFESLGIVSYSHSMVTIAESCVISELLVENCDYSYPRAFDALIRGGGGGSRRNNAITFGAPKTRVVWYCGYRTVKSLLIRPAVSIDTGCV